MSAECLHTCTNRGGRGSNALQGNGRRWLACRQAFRRATRPGYVPHNGPPSLPPPPGRRPTPRAAAGLRHPLHDSPASKGAVCQDAELQVQPGGALCQDAPGAEAGKQRLPPFQPLYAYGPRLPWRTHTPCVRCAHAHAAAASPALRCSSLQHSHHPPVPRAGVPAAHAAAATSALHAAGGARRGGVRGGRGWRRRRRLG